MRWILRLCTLTCLAITLGCGGDSGGGTHGTGGDVSEAKALILGLLIDESGQPINNATISNDSSGNQVTTDVNGRFKILVDINRDAQSDLSISIQSINEKIILDIPPSADNTFQVELELDLRALKLNLISLIEISNSN